MDVNWDSHLGYDDRFDNECPHCGTLLKDGKCTRWVCPACHRTYDDEKYNEYDPLDNGPKKGTIR